MVDRKPTYDDLSRSLKEKEGYCIVINTVLCLLAGFLYFSFLSILIGYAGHGLTLYPAEDNLPVFLMACAYLFLFFYGAWHIFIRLLEIWNETLENCFEAMGDGIDKFFRVFAKTWDTVDNEKPNKARKEPTPDQEVLKV